MRLVIVTGASGALGNAYINALSKHWDSLCIGISRQKVHSKSNDVTYIENLDLLDSESVRKQIDKELPFSRVKEVLLVHPVGKFKFEESKSPEVDIDGDGIDDEVYASNVKTFNNVKNPLLELAEQTGNISDLTLCAFGSVSDRYKVPFWISYSKSKDILRQHISGMARQSGKNVNIKGVFVNVSSVNTGNERQLRPYADMTHWLQPDEIVDDSVDVLIRSRIRNMEMDVFKAITGFDPATYYSESEVVKRWRKDMGKEYNLA